MQVGALEARNWAGLVLAAGPGDGIGVRLAFTTPAGDRREYDDWYWMVSRRRSPRARRLICARRVRPGRRAVAVVRPVGEHPDPGVVAPGGGGRAARHREGARPSGAGGGCAVGVGCALGRGGGGKQGGDGGRGEDGRRDGWRGSRGRRSPPCSPGTGRAGGRRRGRGARGGSRGGDGEPGDTAAARGKAAGDFGARQDSLRPRGDRRGRDPRPGGRLHPARTLDVADGAAGRMVMVAVWGGDPAARARQLLPTAEAWIDEARADWRRRRPRAAGHPGLLESIADNLMWTVLLQPETGRLYTPAGRRWIFPKPRAGAGNASHPDAREDAGGRPVQSGNRATLPAHRDHPPEPDDWTIFGWDTFFNALLLAPVSVRTGLVHSPRRRRSALPKRQRPQLAQPPRRHPRPLPAPRRLLRGAAAAPHPPRP